MKAILEFSLPEDQAEYDLANNAQKLQSVIYDLDQYLGTGIRYEDKEYLLDVRSELCELLADKGLDIF